MTRRSLLVGVSAAIVLATLVLLGGLPRLSADGRPESQPDAGRNDDPLPLKPERTIEFTTDEGTWTSLDVSPDGQTIVFDMLGDLYTVPIDGGQATRVTSGMAFDSQPRYSPDGSLIAHVSDRDGADNVWVAKPDGSAPRKITSDTDSLFVSPAWTPDGQYLVVSRRPERRSMELWMYHLRGGSGIQITKSKPRPDAMPWEIHKALGPIASPDGRYFYYAKSVREYIGWEIMNLPMWQIARRDRITGDEDLVTSAPGGGLRPVLSPDGRLLVYGSRDDAETGLRIRNLETGEDRWLRYPVQHDDQEDPGPACDLLPGYAFTPDGRAVVLSYGGRIHHLDVATGEAREIAFKAHVSQPLGPRLHFPLRLEEGLVRARLVQNATLSPDGRRLAFSALTRLYTMAVPGGRPTRLVPGARAFHPTWSPDGRWLAYVTFGDEGGHIWKTRADGGGEPVRLTRAAAFYRDPVWSPDCARIAALRLTRQQWMEPLGEGYRSLPGHDLIWLPAEGGAARLVVPGRGVGTPHFGPDADRLFVYSPHGVISLRFDGTDRRTHLKIVGNLPAPDPEPAADARVSPDGRFVVAHVQNQLYLLPLPAAGGEPPTVNVHSPALPVKRLTDVGADTFAWADGGKTITWTVGSTFFRLPLDRVSFDESGASAEVAKTGPAAGTAAKEERGVPPAPKADQIDIVVEALRHTPKGTIVLRGARVVTMRADEVLDDADIVVTNNRIAAIGQRGTTRVPDGARVLDVSGATIIPGLVDVHAHWEIRPGVLDTENWALLANLAYGVTTGRDPAAIYDVFAYQDLVDTGEMIGPRVFSTGPAVFARRMESLDEAVDIVSRYAKHYRTHTLKAYAVGNRRVRQWMVEASRRHRIMPTTEGFGDLRMDLTHVLDGFSGNEHNFPTVPLYRDVVELVARSGLFYTPTVIVAYGGPWAALNFFTHEEVHDNPKVRRFVPHYLIDRKTQRGLSVRPPDLISPRVAESVAKIVRAGGRVCLGGHGELQGLQAHWEMRALASGGLTPHEVLRAATLHGAEALGLADDVGSLEAGKLADLVVLSANPLDDIRHTNAIRYVMKNGELFEGDTLDQVWPERKARKPPWWGQEEERNRVNR